MQKPKQNFADNGKSKGFIHVQAPPEIQYPERTVWRLKRQLYGLRDSPRSWQVHLNQVLKSPNLSQMKSDPCTFIGRNSEGSLNLMVMAYVDDLVVAGEAHSVQAFIQESRFSKSQRKTRFSVKKRCIQNSGQPSGSYCGCHNSEMTSSSLSKSCQGHSSILRMSTSITSFIFSSMSIRLETMFMSCGSLGSVQGGLLSFGGRGGLVACWQALWWGLLEG